MTQEPDSANHNDIAIYELHLLGNPRKKDCLVEDLYWILIRSRPAAPQLRSNEVAAADLSPRFRSVPELIPTVDGWYYRPDFLAPEPRTRSGPWWTLGSPVRLRGFDEAMALEDELYGVVDEKRRGELRVRPRKVDKSDEDYLEGLLRLDKKIAERVRKHRLLSRSKPIIAHALAEARADVEAANNEVLLLFGYGMTRSWLRTSQHDERRQFLTRLLPWLRMRLHWLEQWASLEAEKCNEFAADRPSNPRLDNFAALIKPEEVHEAYEHLYAAFGHDDIAEDSSALIQRLLGLWYAQTLWMCGAGWRDLKRVRRASKVRLDRLPANDPRTQRERELGREERRTRFYERWSVIAMRKSDAWERGEHKRKLDRR